MKWMYLVVIVAVAVLGQTEGMYVCMCHVILLFYCLPNHKRRSYGSPLTHLREANLQLKYLDIR